MTTIQEWVAARLKSLEQPALTTQTNKKKSNNNNAYNEELQKLVRGNITTRNITDMAVNHPSPVYYGPQNKPNGVSVVNPYNGGNVSVVDPRAAGNVSVVEPRAAGNVSIGDAPVYGPQNKPEGYVYRPQSSMTNYTEPAGYIKPQQTGVQNQGSGVQNQTGGQERGTGSSNNSQLDAYKSKQSLLEMVKNAIQQKQGMNKDIQASRDYWRTQQRDPMTFTDESLRLLSPEQQQQIRQQRYATAGAHLQGIREEEEYRGTRLEDILSGVKGTQDAELERIKEQRLQVSSDIDNMKKLEGTGYKIGADGTLTRDLTSATAKQIAEAMKQVESGGNYGSKGASGENGAYQYTPGTWNAYSNQYANEVLGQSRQLEMTEENQDKVTEYKVQKWLDQGYSPEQIASMWNAGEGRPNAYAENWRGTNSQGVSYDTPGHVAKVMDALGRIVPKTSSEKHERWSESQVKSLSRQLGKDYTDLWNNYTDIGLDDLQKQTDNSVVEQYLEKVNPRDMMRLGITKVDDLRTLLTLKYIMGATDEEITGITKELGIPALTKEGYPILEEIDLLINPV